MVFAIDIIIKLNFRVKFSKIKKYIKFDFSRCIFSVLGRFRLTKQILFNKIIIAQDNSLLPL